MYPFFRKIKFENLNFAENVFAKGKGEIFCPNLHSSYFCETGKKKKMEKIERKKWVGRLCGFLLLLVLAGIGTGAYFRATDEFALGEKIIGFSVLAFAFVLMPIFLVHRWRGKRLQDYTLTKENIQRMREKGID